MAELSLADKIRAAAGGTTRVEEELDSTVDQISGGSALAEKIRASSVTAQTTPIPVEQQQTSAGLGLSDLIRRSVGAPPKEPEPEPNRAPSGWFGGFVDFLSRGNYASAAFAETILEQGVGVQAVGKALSRAGQELLAPKDRVVYSDVLAKVSPEFAERFPVWNMITGFALDVVLDPVTYLTFGASGLTKTARIGTEAGTQFLTPKGMSKMSQITQRLIAKGAVEGAEAKNRAGKIMGRLLQSDPSLAHEKGLRLTFDLPGKQVDILKPHHLKKVADITGITRAKELLKPYTYGSTMVQDLLGTFNRMKDLPQEHITNAHRLMGDLNRGEREVGKILWHVVRRMPKRKIATMVDGVETNLSATDRIARAASYIDDKVNNLHGSDAVGFNHEDLSRIKETAFNMFGLNAEEIAVYSRMRRALDDVREIDMQVGLLAKEVAEYFPRGYDKVESATELVRWKQQGKMSQANFARSRVFKTTEDAVKAGFVPEYDAITAFSRRILASKRAIAHKRFQDATEQLLKSTKDPTARKAIIRDATQLGYSNRPDLDNAFLNGLARGYDFVTSTIFKTSATILKPAFIPIQVVGNATQAFWTQGIHGVVPKRSWLGSGVKITKALDPVEPFNDAAYYLYHHAKETPLERLKDSTLVSNLGDMYHGPELMKMLDDYNLIQDVGVAGVRYANDAERYLRNQRAWAWVGDKVGDAAKGWIKLAVGGSFYWRWSRHIEAFGKSSLFFNALRLGHVPDEAAKIAHKGLFDYNTGLTQFERQFLKRWVFPFYSYPRFAVALGVETAAKRPGRIANTTKGMKSFFESWNKFHGGEELTEDERRKGIPGWILEQPSAFQKMGIDGKAIFNAFNSFTPVDVFNFIEPGNGQETSFDRTAKKVFLSQINPIIKTPLEQVFNENFFTGRVIKAYEKSKDALGGKGNILGFLENHLPEVVKEAMSWEVATDPKTGEETVYVNPWITHYMTGIVPLTNQFIRSVDGRLTPGESALAVLGNITTYKIDMKHHVQMLQLQDKISMDQRIKEMRYLKKKGLDTSFEQAQQDAREMLQQMQQDWAGVNINNIRGANNK